jgi:hypothetical protein
MECNDAVPILSQAFKPGYATVMFDADEEIFAILSRLIRIAADRPVRIGVGWRRIGAGASRER